MLGLDGPSTSLSTGDIAKAFRKAALRFHPDRIEVSAPASSYRKIRRSFTSCLRVSSESKYAIDAAWHGQCAAACWLSKAMLADAFQGSRTLHKSISKLQCSDVSLQAAVTLPEDSEMVVHHTPRLISGQSHAHH